MLLKVIGVAGSSFGLAGAWLLVVFMLAIIAPAVCGLVASAI
jgi:hypothetical protein